MKTIFMAALILNSVSLYASEVGEKVETVCSAATQSGRSEGLQKEEKISVLKEQAAKSKSK